MSFPMFVITVILSIVIICSSKVLSEIVIIIGELAFWVAFGWIWYWVLYALWSAI